VAVGAVGPQAVQVLILERGRGLTYTPRRESRFRGPRSIDRFAAVLEPGAQFGETFAAILLKILALKLTRTLSSSSSLAAIWPLEARSQQGERIRRIGWLVGVGNLAGHSS
jgi:hypothetical protein